MKKSNIIKTLKYLNPFNNNEKLIIIAREDNKYVERLVFYSSRIFNKKKNKPKRINKNQVKEEKRFLDKEQKEELEKYLKSI